MAKRALVLLVASLSAFSSHAQASDRPVKIGVMEDMSGSLSDSTGAGTVAAVQMAIDDFGGSALGRKIEIVSADHQNKADIATGIARQWYDQDGVSMIVGLGNSSTALAVQQLAREKKKIDIVTAGAASELTNKQCSPSGIHWTYDTYSLAAGTAAGLVKGGQDTWFFITADYSFGKVLESDTRSIVEKNGGKVLGSVRFPLGASDFASYLLTAQSSGAKIVAFASAGGDTVNLIKQSAEFGLAQGKQTTTGLLVFLSDVSALGGKVAAGLKYTTSYSMDADAASREWADRLAKRYSKTPTMPHAGAYTATMHYLKAVAAAKTTDTDPVMKAMRETKINDFMVKDGWIREDGRVVRPMLLVEVKQPSEMKGKYDYEKVIARIPGTDTVRPLAESECPLVRKTQ